ncbi:hypothetical protein ACOYEY_26175, partial [Escherichia coli]
HTDCPLTDFGGKTSIFSHPVYLFLRKFSLQDSRGGSVTGLLVQVARESDDRITALEEENAELKQRLSAIEATLASK